jgi:hypothetical protein
MQGKEKRSKTTQNTRSSKRPLNNWQFLERVSVRWENRVLRGHGRQTQAAEIKLNHEKLPFLLASMS